MRRILVVDDDRDNLEFAVRVLHGEFDVVGLTSGNEALREVERAHFDLIIADQRMPEVCGTHLLEVARRWQPAARRVILSAYTDAPDLIAAINDCRIHRFLNKPVTSAELLACARALVPSERDAAGDYVICDADEARGTELAGALGARHTANWLRELSVDNTRPPSLVVLVEPEGLEVVHEAVARLGGAERPTVLLIGMREGAVADAAAYLRAGVDDVLWPPVRADEVLLRFETARASAEAKQEVTRLRADIAARDGQFALVGHTAGMRKLFGVINQVARTDSNVLVCGETGTGKELVARAIHAASHRREAPFLAVNLSSIPENLTEAELFGHEKGAFTGATQARAGRLEAVGKGTLLLDEIGDLPLSAQVKLLRVLQERTFQRVGSNVSHRAEFRLVCATHRDLPAMVNDGTFREDLYYRINVLQLDVPPLRERLEDIPALAEHFLEVFASRFGVEGLSLREDARRELLAHSWPGNVRELEHTIERAVALARSGTAIGAGLVVRRDRKRSFRAMVDDFVVHGGRGLDELLADIERTVIEETLLRFQGNQSAAATKLQVPRSTMRSRLKKLGL